MSRRRNIAGLAVVARIVFGGVIAAAPAEAATTTCPKGWACVWKDHSFKTDGNSAHYKKFFQWMADYRAYAYEGTNQDANDNVSSVFNNGISEKVRFYDDWHGFGRYIELRPGYGDWNLNDSEGVESGHNDTISSGLYQSYWGTHPWAR